MLARSCAQLPLTRTEFALVGNVDSSPAANSSSAALAASAAHAANSNSPAAAPADKAVKPGLIGLDVQAVNKAKTALADVQHNNRPEDIQRAKEDVAIAEFRLAYDQGDRAAGIRANALIAKHRIVDAEQALANSDKAKNGDLRAMAKQAVSDGLIKAGDLLDLGKTTQYKEDVTAAHELYLEAGEAQAQVAHDRLAEAGAELVASKNGGANEQVRQAADEAETAATQLDDIVAKASRDKFAPKDLSEAKKEAASLHEAAKSAPAFAVDEALHAARGKFHDSVKELQDFKAEAATKGMRSADRAQYGKLGDATCGVARDVQVVAKNVIASSASTESAKRIAKQIMLDTVAFLRDFKGGAKSIAPH
jgi:hypothetical protein